MSPFHYFLYLTNALPPVFHPSYDHLSRGIKREWPKGSPYPRSLAYFISVSLVVSPDRTLSLEERKYKGLLCI